MAITPLLARDSIAHYLDARHEATILAALRHLAQTIRAGSDAMSVDVEEIMSAGGLFAELTADEIDAFGDALASDTWLCQTAAARPDVVTLPFVVQPMRDEFALPGNRPDAETHYVECDDDDADLWAIFDTSKVDPEWMEDRPTRAEAEAVVTRLNAPFVKEA